MVECSSTLFSFSVMSNSLWPHGWGQASFPCPKPTPAAYSKSCPSTWWCDSKISCSVIPFSFWPQSLLASGSFPMSHFFTSGGQSIGISASATVLPMNIQDWFPFGLKSVSLLSRQKLVFNFYSVSFHWLKNEFLSVIPCCCKSCIFCTIW